MPIIAARHYRDGQTVADLDLDADMPPPDGRSDFVWIGLAEPSAEELARIQARFGVHPLAVEDAMAAGQLPKIEGYGDHVFVVARTAHLVGSEIAYGETGIFLGKGYIITVRHGSAQAHTDVRRHLEASPQLLTCGVDAVLHAILDFIVDGYAPIVDAIEERVLEVEDRTMDHFISRSEIGELFTLRRQLVRFSRIIAPMEDVLSRLVNLTFPHIDSDVTPYFRDVLDHVRRVASRVQGLGDIVTSVLETSGLLEQQRQGQITRQLAAWAAILAVPTAIAGIYGMNFDFMPELRWHYGYFIVVGLMFSVCIGLFIRFRKLGWL